MVYWGEPVEWGEGGEKETEMKAEQWFKGILESEQCAK